MRWAWRESRLRGGSAGAPGEGDETYIRSLRSKKVGERGRAAPGWRERERERVRPRRRRVAVGREGGRRGRRVERTKGGTGVEGKGRGDGGAVEGGEGEARRTGVCAIVVPLDPESLRSSSLAPALRAIVRPRRSLGDGRNKVLEAREERWSSTRPPRRRGGRKVGSDAPLLPPLPPIRSPPNTPTLFRSSRDELPPRDSAVEVDPISAAITRGLKRPLRVRRRATRGPQREGGRVVRVGEGVVELVGEKD